MAERRWYRLHPLTWVMILVVGLGALLPQVVARRLTDQFKFGSPPFDELYGWPFTSFMRYFYIDLLPFIGSERLGTPGRVETGYDWRPKSLAANLGAMIAAIVSARYCGEALFRRRRWLQWRLSNLFVAIGVTGVTITFVKHVDRFYFRKINSNAIPDGIGKLDYVRLPDLPLLIRCLVLFALACTAWTSISLAAHLVSRLWSALSSWRSPPASPSAP